MRKIIHSYFTEGMYEWGKLLVESIKWSNGEKYEIILSTRNLKQSQIDTFYKLYNNISVINKELDYKKLAAKANVSVDVLMQYKKQVETTQLNEQSKVWKLMIAGENRIKEVREIVNSLDDGDLLMHLDVDSFIRNPLDPFWELMEKNDYTGVVNVDKQRKAGQMKPLSAIIICFQGYNVNEKSKKFLNTWIAEIDAVQPAARPRGYGQISAYHAFTKVENELRWGDLPKVDIAIGTGGGDNILWGACIGKKDQALKRFRNAFAELKKR